MKEEKASIETLKAKILELDDNYCGLSIAEQRYLEQLRIELKKMEVAA